MASMSVVHLIDSDSYLLATNTLNAGFNPSTLIITLHWKPCTEKSSSAHRNQNKASYCIVFSFIDNKIAVRTQ